MTTVVEVPLNTAIADLDEVLRRMIRHELERHRFEGVDVAFEAPSKDWSGRLTNPTVSLFLYDIREDTERREPIGRWQSWWAGVASGRPTGTTSTATARRVAAPRRSTTAPVSEPVTRTSLALPR